MSGFAEIGSLLQVAKSHGLAFATNAEILRDTLWDWNKPR